MARGPLSIVVRKEHRTHAAGADAALHHVAAARETRMRGGHVVLRKRDSRTGTVPPVRLSTIARSFSPATDFLKVAEMVAAGPEP